MKLVQLELAVIIALVLYIAFFTHPPPRFISAVLESPVGQVIVLLGILFVASQKSAAVGLFLAIAYLTSSYTVLEYLDEKEQKPTEQPKSGAPAPDKASMNKLMGMLNGMKPSKGEKLPSATEKSSTTPPPTTGLPPKGAAPKAKTQEHFSPF